MSAVREQNYRAGRLALEKSMKRTCKCHGVSGSCATQTCWSTLADFDVVAERLKRQYRKAKRCVRCMLHSFIRLLNFGSFVRVYVG